MGRQSTLVSLNPSTGDELGRVTLMDRHEVDAAIARAQGAFSTWSRLRCASAGDSSRATT